MDKLLLLGNGSLIKGMLVLPFAVYGLILVIKGAFAYLDKIDTKYNFTKNWQVGLFGAIHWLSYLGFLYAVSKLF